MKGKLVFGLAFLLVAAVTGISYAAGNSGTTTISVEAGADASGVTSANTDGKYTSSSFSKWTPVKDSTGSTGTGDLYIITRDTENNTDPIYATLYLQNADKLSQDYSYLNLNVTAYGWDGEKWSALEGQTGILSLTNGYLQFTLPNTNSYSKYSISIDGGSFYTINTDTNNLSPKYYLEIL